MIGLGAGEGGGVNSFKEVCKQYQILLFPAYSYNITFGLQGGYDEGM